MARRQVLVQLDDALVRALDKVAGKQHVSRSELLRRAASRFLETLAEEEMDRRHAEGYRKYPQELDVIESFGAIAAETAVPYEE